MRHMTRQALLSSAAILETKGDDDSPEDVVTKALATLQASVDDRFKALEGKGGDADKLKQRLDDIEKKMNRPTGGDGDKPDDAVERKAWVNYLRKGVQTEDLDLKVLTVANDVSAGYLAPAEVSREFIEELTEFSPIRQYATVRQSLAPSVKYPKRLTGTNARWEGEIEEAEESGLTFGQAEIVSHRLTTYVDVSNSLLLGSDGLAEAEVKRAFAEDFAIKEGRAFILGTGNKEPEGILTAPDVPVVPSGAANTYSADSLITLMYALPAPYRSRGVWIMNNLAIAGVRKMKDGQGNFLWQPAFTAGQPETLLGRPIVEAPDMPDVAANSFPIAFGDLATAYRIVDRQQLATLTDPYTQAKRAITRIHGTQWVGAGVVQPKALRKMQIKTA